MFGCRPGFSTLIVHQPHIPQEVQNCYFISCTAHPARLYDCTDGKLMVDSLGQLLSIKVK